MGGRKKPNKQQPKPGRTSDSENDEEYLADYIANTAVSDDDEENIEDNTEQVSEFIKQALRDAELGEMDGCFLDGCSDEDEDEDTSSQDDSEDDNDGDDGEDEEGGWVRYADSHGAGPSSSARASSSRVTQVTMVQTAQDGTTVHVTKSVTLSQAYPFIMRTGDKDTKMGGGGRGRAAQRPKQKSVVKGAMNGKLLPGEKAKLKREKKESKRAAREARSGFDIHTAVNQLKHMMDTEGDMITFDRCGKHGQELLTKLCRLCGLRTSVQRRGKDKACVVAQRPDRMADPSKEVMKQVDALVAAEVARQRKGADAGAGVGPEGMSLTRPAKYDRRVTQPLRRAHSSGGNFTRLQFQQPVAFVSHGVAVDDSPAQAVLIKPAPNSVAAAAAAALAAAPGLGAGDASSPSSSLPGGDAPPALGADGEGRPQSGGALSFALASPPAGPLLQQQAGAGTGDDSGVECDKSGDGNGEGEADEGARGGLGSSGLSGAKFGLGAGWVREGAGLGAAPQPLANPGRDLWDMLEQRFAACQIVGGEEEEEVEPELEEVEQARGMEAHMSEGVGLGGKGNDCQDWEGDGDGYMLGGLGHKGLGAGDSGEAGSDGEGPAQMDGREEEEEEEHMGLGFVRSGGYTYHRSAFSLGLGAPSTSQPPPSTSQSGPEGSSEGADAAQGDRLGGGGGSGSEHDSDDRGGDSGMAATEYLDQYAAKLSRHERQQEALRQQGRRGRRQAVREYLLGGAVGEAPGSGRGGYVGRGGALPVNFTKQDAKKAAKKAEKEERRAQRRGEMAAAASAAAAAGGTRPDLAVPTELRPSDLHYHFAAFERHTSGIGSKLMMAMGWSEGQGLGRASQGIAQPLQAVQRPKNRGLGC